VQLSFCYLPDKAAHLPDPARAAKIDKSNGKGCRMSSVQEDSPGKNKNKII
jgi:hypothetical protein